MKSQSCAADGTLQRGCTLVTRTTSHRRPSVRHSPFSGPGWVRVPYPGTGTAPETGRPPARLTAINQQSSPRKFRPAFGPIYIRVMTAIGRLRVCCNLMTRTTRHRRPSVRHSPSPGPGWVRDPAPWHGDGARNGAAACATYCRDNASSRAAGLTATIWHLDFGPRTTLSSPQSSQAHRQATGDKTGYGTGSP